MYIIKDAIIKSIPENFIKISEIWAVFFNPFKNDVKTPANITITPCPNEKQNNIKEDKIIFFVNVAKLIIPAKMGVEQGLDAKANKIPIKNG